MAKLPNKIYVKNAQAGDEKYLVCDSNPAALLENIGDDLFVGVYELVATQRVKSTIAISNKLKAKRK